MWVFLAQEVMFFGGLFAAYALYRGLYPEAFASTSKHMGVLLGAVNTAVLICSSLTMVLAVHAAQLGKRKLIVVFLIVTMIFGSVFLGIKAYEWYEKFAEHHVPGPGFQRRRRRRDRRLSVTR